VVDKKEKKTSTTLPLEVRCCRTRKLAGKKSGNTIIIGEAGGRSENFAEVQEGERKKERQPNNDHLEPRGIDGKREVQPNAYTG